MSHNIQQSRYRIVSTANLIRVILQMRYRKYSGKHTNRVFFLQSLVAIIAELFPS